MSLRPLTVLGIILAVRLSSVYLVQTSFVPDEYYQSLEVAHKQAFGYGYISWEWKKGIRSYLFPIIFTGLYKLLDLTTLDLPIFLIYLPRIFMALLTAASDYAFYKWSGKRRWGLFLILTPTFTYYCASRTLINTVEYALITIALSVFPFKEQLESKWSSLWLAIACVTSYIRPTAAIIWAPLALSNISTCKDRVSTLILKTYLPICFTCVSTLVGVDYLFYGKLVFSPWEFIKENLFNDVGSHYGTHPWYWYFSTGSLIILGGLSIAIYWAAAWTFSNGSPRNILLLLTALLYMIALSFIPHKEFRFLMPILPFLLFVTQDVIVTWSRTANRYLIMFVASLLLITNLLPALYLGIYHQRGVLDVMSILREDAQNDPHNTNILFAMPCHSTPLYSHLHVNVTTRMLDCTPPQAQGKTEDESDQFFKDPNRWFRTEFANKRKPSHIVLFDKLVPRFQQSLAMYKGTHKLFHTHFPDGEVSKFVLIYRKEPPTKDQQTQTS